MKRTVFRILAALVVLALMLPVVGVSAVQAGKPVNGPDSTVDGYATWDSDMVNIEAVSQTGAGVYVAVIDTGMVPNWRDYFPGERVATEFGIGFDQSVTFKSKGNPCEFDVEVGPLRQTGWVGSSGSTHGTHVASTILGYFYRSNSDAAAGYPLPAIMVRGIAPEVKIIPVKVLADYQIPARPKCDGGMPGESVVFGTDGMVTAGINYVAELKETVLKDSPVVINMSLGSSEASVSEQAAIDRAIEAGVIVVASAGNEGEAGMGYPGAYPEVISVGASGWTGEWLKPSGEAGSYRLWWLQSGYYPYLDIPEGTPTEQVYVTDFSSRELPGQYLDVLAPGSWVRGPYPGDPGYSHLPWWSKGIGDLAGGNPGNFYYLGGTSMAAPHVAAISALMLEANPELMQAEVEYLLKETALEILPGSADVSDRGNPVTYTWGADAVGSGLVQADLAVNAALTY